MLPEITNRHQTFVFELNDFFYHSQISTLYEFLWNEIHITSVGLELGWSKSSYS